MRNYIQLFTATILYNNVGQPPPDFKYEVCELNLEALDEEILLVSSQFTPPQEFRGISGKGSHYVLLDKYNLNQALRYVNQILPFNQTNQLGILWEGDPDTTPRDGWKDAAGVKRKPPPSESGGTTAGGGKGGLTVSGGIWIIARLFLYFAGFEAGTGDPIFVKYVLGAGKAPNAFLYLSLTQAVRQHQTI